MPFSNQGLVKLLLTLLISVIGLLLAIVGFFSAKTYASIEKLSVDVADLRLELRGLEAGKLSRADVREIVADYHESHMNYNYERNKQ